MLPLMGTFLWKLLEHTRCFVCQLNSVTAHNSVLFSRLPAGFTHRLNTQRRWTQSLHVSQRHGKPTTGMHSHMFACLYLQGKYAGNEIIKGLHVFLLPTAAQFLGSGDLWENRGARFGLRAEPQVHQHLPYEDTGHVDTWTHVDLETSTSPLLDAAWQLSYLLWYNSWERLYATGGFTLTLVGFQPTKDYNCFVLTLNFHLLWVFINVYPVAFILVVLLSILYYKWDMVNF